MSIVIRNAGDVMPTPEGSEASVALDSAAGLARTNGAVRRLLREALCRKPQTLPEIDSRLPIQGGARRVHVRP